MAGPLARWFVAALTGYVTVGALVSLGGWVFDVPRLSAWEPGGIAIQPNAALAAVLTGLALCLLLLGFRAGAGRLGLLVSLLGSATLLQHAAGIDLGIDTRLMFDRAWGRAATVVPGRMGVPASLSWTLLGIALSAQLRPQVLPWVVPALPLLVAGIAGVSITGYTFGADRLYALPRVSAIALQTATFLLASSIVLIAAAPDRDPMRTFLSPRASGLLARRTIPVLVAVPLAVGYLRILGQQAGLYDTAMGAALLVSCLIAITCAVVWRGWRALDAYEFALAAANAAKERAGRAQRESDVRLATLLEQLPLGVGVADRSGRWVLANPSLQRWSHDRIPSANDDERPRWRSWTGDGQPLVPTQWPVARALRGETVNPGVDFHYRGDDGRGCWLRVSAAPFRDGDGTVTGAICVVQDIDDQKRAAEALLDADRRKDEFLATLAHELRNPLAPIRSGLEALRRAPDDADLAVRLRETMAHQVDHLVRLIDDLLDVSRITHDRIALIRQPVVLQDVIAQAIAICRPAIDASAHRLEVHAGSQPLVVDGDQARLVQVVSNLLSNAAKYTPPGGTLAVHAFAEEETAIIRVTDTGVGIPTAILPHVFDKFIQVPRDGFVPSGLGLGLSIVKGLVERHGGRVLAESDGPAQGAAFVVSLPLLPQEVAPADVSGPATSAARRRRILVADDNADAAEMLAILLRADGHDVDVAHDGQTALERAHATAPDVALLDIGMPALNGLDVCRRLRELPRGADMLIVAISGWGQAADRQRSQQAGFDHHLVKPVDHRVVQHLLASSD